MADGPSIWRASISPLDLSRIDGILARYPQTTLEGADRLRSAQYGLMERHGFLEEPKHPLPEINPSPTLIFPHPNSFLPDMLKLRGYTLCSARLRDAIAQPPEVVQYTPVVTEAADPRVQDMQYRVMRVIGGQHVVNIGRSDAEITRLQDRFIGGEAVFLGYTRQLVLLEGLQARTELFHASEQPLKIFATDSLAERVMQAGCLGMQFSDPEHRRFSNEEPLIRTARGVERRSPATRAAHLRLVKRVRAADPRFRP